MLLSYSICLLCSELVPMSDCANAMLGPVSMLPTRLCVLSYVACVQSRLLSMLFNSNGILSITVRNIL